MNIEVITKEDFQHFKEEMLEAMTEVIGELLGDNKINSEEYLKSGAARKLMGGISEGSLYNLRTKGLPFVRLSEGIYLYKKADLLDYMARHRIDYSSNDLIT